MFFREKRSERMKTAYCIFFRTLGYSLLLLAGAGAATKASPFGVITAAIMAHLAIVASIEIAKD